MTLSLLLTPAVLSTTNQLGRAAAQESSGDVVIEGLYAIGPIGRDGQPESFGTGAVTISPASGAGTVRTEQPILGAGNVPCLIVDEGDWWWELTPNEETLLLAATDDGAWYVEGLTLSADSRVERDIEHCAGGDPFEGLYGSAVLGLYTGPEEPARRPPTGEHPVFSAGTSELYVADHGRGQVGPIENLLFNMEEGFAYISECLGHEFEVVDEALGITCESSLSPITVTIDVQLDPGEPDAAPLAGDGGDFVFEYSISAEDQQALDDAQNQQGNGSGTPWWATGLSLLPGPTAIVLGISVRAGNLWPRNNPDNDAQRRVREQKAGEEKASEEGLEKGRENEKQGGLDTQASVAPPSGLRLLIAAGLVIGAGIIGGSAAGAPGAVFGVTTMAVGVGLIAAPRGGGGPSSANSI